MTESPTKQGNYGLDLGGSFLTDLPPSIKRYTYHGEPQFFDILESESARFKDSPHASEFLLFHATKETIETLIDSQDEHYSPITKYLTSFDTNERLFLVRMPSTPHGVAGPAMNTAILEALQPMGLRHTAIRGYLGAEVRGESRGKETDFGWGPRRITDRGTRSSPSVVLEVAYSENDVKLNSDVRFWLDPNNGNATVCLTLRIGRSVI